MELRASSIIEKTEHIGQGNIANIGCPFFLDPHYQFLLNPRLIKQLQRTTCCYTEESEVAGFHLLPASFTGNITNNKQFRWPEKLAETCIEIVFIR